MPIPSKQSAPREKSDSTLTPRGSPTVSLLPCPFDNGQGLHGTQVRGKCGAEGPNARDPAEAIAAWNRRSDPIREELVGVLNTALDMLVLIAMRMPAGSSVRNALDAECDAMRSASRAIIAKASRDSQPEGEAELKSE